MAGDHRVRPRVGEHQQRLPGPFLLVPQVVGVAVVPLDALIGQELVEALGDTTVEVDEALPAGRAVPPLVSGTGTHLGDDPDDLGLGLTFPVIGRPDLQQPRQHLGLGAQRGLHDSGRLTGPPGRGGDEGVEVGGLVAGQPLGQPLRLGAAQRREPRAVGRRSVGVGPRRLGVAHEHEIHGREPYRPVTVSSPRPGGAGSRATVPPPPGSPGPPAGPPATPRLPCPRPPSSRPRWPRAAGRARCRARR